MRWNGAWIKVCTDFQEWHGKVMDDMKKVVQVLAGPGDEPPEFD